MTLIYRRAGTSGFAPGARHNSLLSAGILAGALIVSGGAVAQDAPDAIYHNGNILTVDDDFTTAEAVAIRDGRFVSVGGNQEVLELAGPDTQVVDLEGQTVIPGLMDTHSHLDGAGAGATVVQLGGVSSAEEALERIRAFVQDKPEGAWIRSSGWHPPSLIGRYLTRQEIDSVAPDNPVFLSTVGHFAMANTMALEIAGVTDETADPAGGHIERDETGAATGVLEEAAMDLVSEHIPPLSYDERYARHLAAQEVYNSYGITSMVVTGASEEMIELYQNAAEAGDATLRLAPMWRPEIRGEENTDALRDMLANTELVPDSGDEWVRINGVKISIDGGMTLRTASTREPYHDDPDFYGTLSVIPDVYKEAVLMLDEAGWRVMTHAVGDGAVDLVLDAYNALNDGNGPDEDRWSITHGSLIQPDQVQRAADLNVRVDAQNVFMWEKAATVAQGMGMDIAQRAVPTRMLIDVLGLDMTAAGTDSPGTNIINPYINLYIMVTRKDPDGDVFGADQAITREEALRLYTASGPYLTGEEDLKGTIEEGKLADMVVLSDNFLEIPEEEIKDLEAVMTIVDGEVVFDRNGA